MKTGVSSIRQRLFQAFLGVIPLLVVIPGAWGAAASPIFQKFTQAPGTNAFELTSGTRIIFRSTNDDIGNIVDRLKAPRGWLETLRRSTGLDISIVVSTTERAERGDIVVTDGIQDLDFLGAITETKLTITRSNDASKKLTVDITDRVKEEGFKYRASLHGVTIQYNGLEGAFRGFQSLVQHVMRDSNGVNSHRELPLGEGIDYPKLENRYISIDVARVPLSVEQITGLMEKMSLHKLNRLVMLLNDDIRATGQTLPAGYFRLETAAGGNSAAPDGDVYTREEWDSLEAAAERYGIELVPQFTSMGHSQAWKQYTEAIGVSIAFFNAPTGEDYNYGFLELNTPERREIASTWMADFIKSYRGWFKSDRINIGGLADGGHRNYWNNIVSYSNLLYNKLIYDASTNPDGFREISMFVRNDKNVANLDPGIEIINWNKSDSVDFIKNREAKWFDSHINSYGWWPAHGDGVRPGTEPKPAYETFRKNRYDQYVDAGTFPAGIGIYNMNYHPARSYSGFRRVDYTQAGLRLGIPSIGLVGWYGLITNNDGTAITAYANTNYDDLQRVGAELQYHWLQDLYPSRYPYIAGDREKMEFYLDYVFRYMRIFLGAGVNDNRLEPTPDNRNNHWFGWNTEEIFQAGRGPALFNSDFVVELVGEGGTLSSGHICRDALYNREERSFSLCDRDDWMNNIYGAGGLHKKGVGSLFLSGRNTFSGDIVLEEGKILVRSNDNLGANAPLKFTGGTLVFMPGSGNVVLAGGRDVEVQSSGGVIDLNENTVAIDGEVSGSGTLRKMGTGVLQLKGTNTFSGSLRMDEGIVEVYDADSLGTSLLTFSGGGTLLFNSQFNLPAANRLMTETAAIIDTNGKQIEILGDIFGSGRLIKTGAGTLNLKGANTYTGGTYVNEGWLVGTGGPLQGNIFSTSSVTVVFDQATDGVFDGNISISGAGLLVKQGTGALRLRGNTAGAWEVKAGSLENEGDLYGDIDIAAGSQLNYVKDGDVTYGGALSGGGQFIQSGEGQLVLSGDSRSFAGGFNVKANSTLFVSGRIKGDVTVEANGEFGSSGFVQGDVTVASQGTFWGGGGRLEGVLYMAPGGNYRSRVTSNSIVGGAVFIAGSSLLVLGQDQTMIGNPFNRIGEYDIITSGGGIVGRFADFATARDFPFMDFELKYTTTKVQIVTTENASPISSILNLDNPEEEEVSTANTEAMAKMLDDARSTTDSLGVLESAIMILPRDPEVIKESLDSLSGEIHASVKSAFISSNADLRLAVATQSRAAMGADSLGVRGSLNTRFSLGDRQWGLGANGSSGAVLWLKPLVAWGKNPGGDEFKDIEYEGSGFLIGGDAGVYGDWHLGFFGGVSNTEFFQRQRRETSGKDNGQHAGLYGSRRWEKLSLYSGFGYTRHNIDASRIATVGNNDITLVSEYDASTFGVFSEVSYQFERNNAMIEPFVEASYTKHTTNPFSEIAVAEDGTKENIFLMTEQNSVEVAVEVGARVSAPPEVWSLPGNAHLHGMLSLKIPTKEAKIVIPQSAGNAQPVDIRGAPISGNSITAEAGVDFSLEESTHLLLVYSYSQLTENNSNVRHSFQGKFTYDF